MDLVAEAQDEPGDDSAAMNEIVRRFEGLASKMAKSLTPSSHTKGDLANAALLGLVRAVRRHDPKREGFITFASQYMRGAALRELKVWASGTTELSIEQDQEDVLPLPATPGADETANVGSPWDLLEGAVSLLEPRQQDLLTYRYVLELNLSEIGEIEGTSTSAVSQRLRNVLKALGAELAA